MKRRSFLAALGMAPLAGAAAVKQEAASLGSMPTGLGAGAAGRESDWQTVSSVTAMGNGGWAERLAKVAGYISKNGVPEWKRQELLRQIRVTQLDPDLVANRSFSLASKMRMQRDRIVAKEIDRMVEAPKWSDAERKFTEAMGFNL